jgi:hypothetical protein
LLEPSQEFSIVYSMKLLEEFVLACEPMTRIVTLVVVFCLCMSTFEIQDQDLIKGLQRKKKVEVFVGR